MKTLKILSSFVLIVLCLNFYSCKKSDDSIPSPLIGHWAEKPSIEQFNYVFNANGTGEFYVLNCTTLSRLGSSEIFTYVFDNNAKTLTMKGPDIEDNDSWSATISGNELTLVYLVGKEAGMTFHFYRQ
jgi:hypothetical protein